MPDRVDTELRTAGVFEEKGTPLYQFAQGLELRGPTTGELLGESRRLTERRAGRMEETGAALERQAKNRGGFVPRNAPRPTRGRSRPTCPRVRFCPRRRASLANFRTC